MTFDDSLPTLVRVLADDLTDVVISEGIVLRDTMGRLAFFASIELPDLVLAGLGAKLTSALGAYARKDRVVDDIRGYGVVEILNDSLVLYVTIEDHAIRLIDRRLVGGDWLRIPAPASAPPPRFIFSSLKGGVGRSTALSVAAADAAARGRRVLAIDLDMEAPGLGAFLLDEETTPEFGIVDALVEMGLSTLDDQFLYDIIGPSRLADGHGAINIVPAFGTSSLRNPADVLSKLSRAYADKVDEDGVTTLLDKVRSLIDRLVSLERYDLVLVDARAGLNESTASAILGLGGEVLLFGLNEPQTFQGYAAMLAHLARLIRPSAPRPEWLERLTLVQGKASADASERDDFAERCRELFAKVGLGAERLLSQTELSVETQFEDVQWLEDAEQIPLEHEFSAPLAILYDEGFQRFDPLKKHDQISRPIYESSYGTFLKFINEPITA